MKTWKIFPKLILTLICCNIVLSSAADKTNVTVTNNNQTSDNNSVSNSTLDKTHWSREQVTVHEENVKPTDSKKPTNSTVKLSDVAKKYEATFPNTTGSDDGDKSSSKPRKGVTLVTDPPANNSSIVANNTKSSTVASSTATSTTPVKPTTTKKVVKKPLFTEHIEKPIVPDKSNDDNLDDKVIYNSGNNKSHRNTNQADYIIPIVAVILSVPLVAIAMAYLYKKGADWYQHRNYRRMDFLIEGMYNN